MTGMINPRKTLRLLTYWLLRLFSLDVPFGLLGMATSLVVAKGLGFRPYHGIKLMALPPHKLEALTEVWNALELIRRTDPRRFARVKRFIRRVFVTKQRTWAFYWRFGKICSLRKLAMPESFRSLAVYDYAATLVHESTHGLLYAKGFLHSRVNRGRIERICVKEEARFLAKFPSIDQKLELVIGFEDGWPRWRFAPMASSTGSPPATAISPARICSKPRRSRTAAPPS